MERNTKERWVELCEQAAVEQDSKKLQKLVQEIDRLLREKQERLERAAMKNDTSVGQTGSMKDRVADNRNQSEQS